MLQIVVIIVGLLVTLTGFEAIQKGSIQISSSRRLEGEAAKRAGAATMVAGLGIVAFAAIGFSLLFR